MMQLTGVLFAVNKTHMDEIIAATEEYRMDMEVVR
jgi:hypothetical protein